MPDECCAICHVEIPAPDLEKAGAFYREAFGWVIRPMSETYLLFSAGDLGGGLDADAPVSGGGPVLVLQVSDIPAKLETIRAQGGTPITEKTEIGDDHGFYAYFLDPNGNRLGVWSKS